MRKKILALTLALVCAISLATPVLAKDTPKNMFTKFEKKIGKCKKTKKAAEMIGAVKGFSYNKLGNPEVYKFKASSGTFKKIKKTKKVSFLGMKVKCLVNGNYVMISGNAKAQKIFKSIK